MDAPDTEPMPAAGEPEPIFELAQEPESSPEASEPEPEAVEPERQAETDFRPEPEPEPIPEEPLPPRGQPASQSTVEKAIEEVSEVVEALRNALEEMEEVLELLEVFERQKNADEREIESLRRAVRQIHRPRDSGHHHHR